VRVDGSEVGRIGRGFLLLVGVGRGDDERAVDYLVDKVINLRVFEDGEGKMNLSLLDVGGEILAVSQFTLYADTRRGRRPSFTNAAPPAEGERMYRLFVERMRRRGVRVETGVFGAMMEVELVNDGPVTIILERDGVSV